MTITNSKYSLNLTGFYGHSPNCDSKQTNLLQKAPRLTVGKKQI